MRHGKIRYLVLMGNAESPERDTQVCIPKALPTYPAKYFFNNNSNDHMRQLWESVKGKKGSKRSLHAKLDSIERTAKDVLEEEFGLTLTPRQKEMRFTKEGALAGRWVKRWSTDLAILSWLNPFNNKRGSIVHSLSLSSLRRPDMT